MNQLLKVLATILLVAVFAVSLTLPSEASAQVQSTNEILARGNTAFAVQLYRELGSLEGNIFFSPYSVSSALGMTYAGARGKTAKEMAGVLHFGLNQSELHSAFKNLNGELTTTAQKNGQKLNIANALALTGGNVSDEFKTMLRVNYSAEIFSGGLNVINDWVKKKTDGKIEKILEKLSPNSVCVLLNAIYFKGIWESQFQKTSTHDSFFNISSDKKVKVPFMYQKNGFRILREKDFQAISMPYKGENMSMVILLPKDIHGLAALERQFTIQNLKEWFEKLDKQSTQLVKLYLPKFKLETTYDLLPPLQRMGIQDAFGVTADFSGMGWKKGELWISQVKHKAFVEVNEEGTEAAAATAVEMATKSVDLTPVFRASHPFALIIRDNKNDSVLFMGRMVNPQ